MNSVVMITDHTDMTVAPDTTLAVDDHGYTATKQSYLGIFSSVFTLPVSEHNEAVVVCQLI